MNFSKTILTRLSKLNESVSDPVVFYRMKDFKNGLIVINSDDERDMVGKSFDTPDAELMIKDIKAGDKERLDSFKDYAWDLYFYKDGKQIEVEHLDGQPIEKVYELLKKVFK